MKQKQHMTAYVSREMFEYGIPDVMRLEVERLLRYMPDATMIKIEVEQEIEVDG